MDSVCIQLRGQQGIVVDNKGHTILFTQGGQDVSQPEQILPGFGLLPHLENIDAPGDRLFRNVQQGPSVAVFLGEDKIKTAVSDGWYAFLPK